MEALDNLQIKHFDTLRAEIPAMERLQALKKLLLNLASYGFPALLFYLALCCASTDARAVTEAEHDAHRQAVAARYDRLNETLRTQSADWNRIIGTKSTGELLIARRQRFVECTVGLNRLNARIGTCTEERNAYIEQLKIAGAEQKKNTATDDAQAMEAIKLIDQHIEHLGSDQNRTLSQKEHQRLCNGATLANVTLYRTYEKYLRAGQHRRAMKAAGASASTLQKIALLRSQCSHEAAEGRHWDQRQASALRELTLISFVQATLDPRFVGLRACIDTTKRNRPLRGSQNASSFGYVCTLLIDREMFLGLDAANRWFSNFLRAMRVKECQNAIVRTHAPKLDELVAKNFSGSWEAVPGCNISRPPWTAQNDLDKADKLRGLMYSAINLR